MQHRLIPLEYTVIVASVRPNFKGVFRKIFTVINRIYDLEFVINFAILLHFVYNFSQGGFVKGGGRFFFFKKLCIQDGYGHSFFTVIFNMIDGFQDLLFHFSNQMNYFFQKCVISTMTVYSNRNRIFRCIFYLVTESPYKVHKYKRFKRYYKKII